MGSCFIYGGRQLGKTALLCDIERSFHTPSEGQIALWIDLKTRGIGVDRPIDEIWQILTGEFKKLGVLPTNLPDHTGPDRLFERIQEWLEMMNSVAFSSCWMKRTASLPRMERGIRASSTHQRTNGQNERRFKVLFAGLHNVQRTTKQENHPLAHYGDPLCIGPLLANGEWREARALVERPLASLGFRFESPDLVTRILSQTNYTYGSLIFRAGWQQPCKALYKYLQRSPKRPGYAVAERREVADANTSDASP